MAKINGEAFVLTAYCRLSVYLSLILVNVRRNCKLSK